MYFKNAYKKTIMNIYIYLPTPGITSKQLARLDWNLSRSAVLPLYLRTPANAPLFPSFPGDKERYSLQQDTSVVHAEFTYFYYPGDTPFPCEW